MLTKHSEYLTEDILGEIWHALHPQVTVFLEHVQKSWCIENEEELVRGLRGGIGSIL